MNSRRDLDIILIAGSIGVFLFGLSSREIIRAETDCDVDCLSEKVVSLTKRVATLEKVVGVGTAKTATKAVTKETFRDIGGGSATGMDWTKIPGSDFYFDQSLYGNVVSVSWQGWVEGGVGSVRLFDATNVRGVDYSEISMTANGRASFYSGNLAIWRGQNWYYVQVKHPTLGTAVTVTGARLRIVTK